MLSHDLYVVSRRMRWQLRRSVLSVISATACSTYAAFLILHIDYTPNPPDLVHAPIRIYQVTENDGLETPAALAPALQQAYPLIDAVTSYREAPGLFQLHTRKAIGYEPRIFLADTSFFEVFPIPLIIGERGGLLAGRRSIVLSETLARKYFDDLDSISGRSIYTRDSMDELTVTGVYTDFPASFSVRPDAVIYDDWADDRRNWRWRAFRTCLRLPEGAADTMRILDRMQLPENAVLIRRDYGLVRLPEFRVEPYNTPKRVPPSSIFMEVLPSFVILSLTILFVQLSTVRFALRSRESGLRLVNGAAWTETVRLALTEAAVIWLSGGGLAVPLIFVLYPLASEVAVPTIYAAAATAGISGLAMAVVTGKHLIIWKLKMSNRDTV